MKLDAADLALIQIRPEEDFTPVECQLLAHIEALDAEARELEWSISKLMDERDGLEDENARFKAERE